MSVVDDLFARAVAFHREGRMDEAEAAYRDLAAREDCPTQALNNLAGLALSRGRIQDAAELLRRSLTLAPQQPRAATTLGHALYGLNLFQQALESYDAALTLGPSAEAYEGSSLALHALGRHGEALERIDQAVVQAPDSARAHNNRGAILRTLGRPGDALASHDRAIALEPAFTSALGNKALALEALGDFAGALAEIDKAIALAPQDATLHYNRGNILQRDPRERDEARLAAAVASYDRAIAFAPHAAEAHNNRGIVLRKLGRLQEAAESHSRAAALDRNYTEAINNHAVILQELGRHDDAMAQFNRALQLAPERADTQWNKSLLLLLRGDYAGGWPLYEWRWRSSELGPHARDFPMPLWQGEDLSGKRILLHAEQGLGDALQFCRYVFLVAARGAEVVFEVHKPLVSLMATLTPPITVIARPTARTDFDFHAPLLSLPGIFGTTLDTVPAAVPYLRPDPVKQAAWRARLTSGRRRIGLVWTSGQAYKNSRSRNLPFAALEPLLREDFNFHSLQKENDPAEVAAAQGIHFHGTGLADFSDTAALAAEMDLIISVDTSVAHLAGALGKPLWVLLAFAPDFRWLLERSDSPWYPTARLFRPTAPGGWAGVIEQVVAALKT